VKSRPVGAPSRAGGPLSRGVAGGVENEVESV
jgi:hypothetical protein